MTALERADGFKTPAGNSAACVLASTSYPRGILDPVEPEWRVCGNHGDPVAGADTIAQPVTSLNSEERDARSLEVGGTHSSDELW